METYQIGSLVSDAILAEVMRQNKGVIITNGKYSYYLAGKKIDVLVDLAENEIALSEDNSFAHEFEEAILGYYETGHVK